VWFRRFLEQLRGGTTDQTIGVGRDHVVWGYRLFLDRDPEAEAAIRQKLAAHSTTSDLRRDFMSSSEFRIKNGPDLAYTPSGCIVIKQLPSGLRLFVDLSDIAIGLNVARNRYEESEARFVSRSLKPGDSVLDIGANIGFHTIQMASRVGPEGRVYAFEPVPANLALLEKSIDENGLRDRIVLERAALGEQAGGAEIVFLSLEEGSFNSGGAYLRATGQPVPPGHHLLPVRVIRLDEYPLRRPVNFLKIDVEGAEPLALRGARGILTSDRPVILSEINPQQLVEVAGSSPAVFIREVTSLGYECRLLHDGSPGEIIRDVPSGHPRSAVFLPR
jgi:FkbM family methyltransferase